VAPRKKRGRSTALGANEHGNAKFANATIEEVLRLGAAGMRQVDIAARTGVSQPYVSQLLAGDVKRRKEKNA
jgi:predicted XRE-type DNA-binding protein